MLKFAWFNLIFILLLIPTHSFADFTDHVTLTHYPPGSFKIKYSGVRGFLINQIKSQLWNLHSDYLDIYHPFDNDFRTRSKRELVFVQRELDTGGAWCLRRWWESFPPDKGGAPKGITTFYVGRKKIVLDIGFAYITPDFKFRLRQYVVDITKPKAASSWKMKIRPSLRFSLAEIISWVKISVLFQYSRLGIKTINVEFYCTYVCQNSKFLIGFNIYHLKW